MRKVIWGLTVFVLTISMLQPADAFASSSIKIAYGGKTRTYKGKQLTFAYNKKSVTSNVPGIQINKINMIPYYNVIVKRGPKVKRTYKNGKLTLKYGTKTLICYKNKKTCYVNGKKKTLSVAPTAVKYYSVNKNYLLLPANFVIKQLGLTYSYIPYDKKIHINKTGTRYTTAKNTTTKYNCTLASYITAQKTVAVKYNNVAMDYSEYIPVNKDTTHSYQYLRLNVFRPVETSTYKKLLNKNVKSSSPVYNQGTALVAAAKKYNIDPVYFLAHTVKESAGTSAAAQSKSITKVISGSSLVKSSSGTVTGFKMVNGKYITKTISAVKVYNLYGFKAGSSAEELCAYSYAYYMGWTSVSKSITGAAKYMSDNYINNKTYQQNTLYKFRYIPNKKYISHIYTLSPDYTANVAKTIYSTYKSAYATGNIMVYDKPVFN